MNSLDISFLTTKQRKKLARRYNGRLIRPAARLAGVHHSLVSRVMHRRATSRRAEQALNAILAQFSDIREVWVSIGGRLPEEKAA